MTPTWVPVIFGIITPMSFTTNGILTKTLTNDRIKFDPSTLSFGSYFIVNIMVLIVAIPYWYSNGNFSQYLFWMGFVGSVINTLGIVCIQNALSCGPAGPISALAASASFFLVIIEAIKAWRMLSLMETIGLILGLYGALILVIPDTFAKLCCFCCLDKLRDEDEVAQENTEEKPQFKKKIGEQE